MKTFFAIVACVILFIVGAVLSFGLEIGSIRLNGIFKQERAKVERKVFKETQSYNEAKIQELSKMYYEYLKADIPNKAVIKSVVRLQFADYSTSKLPLELVEFVTECKGY